MSRLIVFSTILTMLVSLPSAWVHAEILPDSQVQVRLSELFIAQGQEAWNSKEAIIRETAESLKKEDYSERHRFLEQLVYFTAFNEGKVHETPFAVGLLIKWAGFTEREIVEATIPHWIGASEPLKRAIDEWVEVLGESGHSQTFDDLAPYFAGSADDKSAPSENWVAYLFYRSPKRALLTFEQVYGSGEKGLDRLRNATKGDPCADLGKIREVELKKFGPEELEKLKPFASSPDWWVRMYALSIARHLGTPEAKSLIGALSMDKNEVVRRAALRLVRNETQ